MAKLTVGYNNPDLPKGTEIDIAGVGLVKNGGRVTFTDLDQERYMSETGIKLSDALKENPGFSVAPDETPGEKSAAKEAREQGVERSED